MTDWDQEKVSKRFGRALAAGLLVILEQPEPAGGGEVIVRVGFSPAGAAATLAALDEVLGPITAADLESLADEQVDVDIDAVWDAATRRLT